MADEQLAGRLNISLKGAGFGAEPLTPNLRSRIRAAWGLEPTIIYAATESPVIASSTPEHAELEIDEDLVVVEVVDDHNDAVPPGHRFATRDIPAGDFVCQYGQPIGTSRGIAEGDPISHANMSNDVNRRREFVKGDIVKYVFDGASNAMIHFRHPDGGSSRLDR